MVVFYIVFLSEIKHVGADKQSMERFVYLPLEQLPLHFVGLSVSALICCPLSRLF